jgi:hypothetical protein
MQLLKESKASTPIAATKVDLVTKLKPYYSPRLDSEKWSPCFTMFNSPRQTQSKKSLILYKENTPQRLRPVSLVVIKGVEKTPAKNPSAAVSKAKIIDKSIQKSDKKKRVNDLN